MKLQSFHSYQQGFWLAIPWKVFNFYVSITNKSLDLKFTKLMSHLSGEQQMLDCTGKICK